MLKTFVSAALTVSMLAACSSASGPTFNAYAIDLADGSRAYRVECHGLFESSNACMRAAQRVCGDQPVRPLDRLQRLSDPAQKIDDPGAMTFQCGVPPQLVVATPAPVAEKPIVLAADALFAFDKADVDAIKPEGRAELDEIASKLSAAPSVRHVDVVGYTDRLGSDEYNAALSQRRAETVKWYLTSQGVTAQIDARGDGKVLPGTACEMRNRAELIRCLAPDRRVEIRPSRTQ
ncbi:OmpA family protein [Burkholderia ambifaria]|jgi:outer membrane protein OmpA-like peptidoglycan-associated protein|uniref:OmpA/MotB domain protein n=2 Tax=Burkholderia ambifaria TaxID=152480 RepID=B1FMC9_9BURK|nr:OmpA family protein [Burkholderia ambifaria]EDT01283.1 OmpA/MotB domain protein [Burkholderia ambifaria IOP40-10]